MARKIWEGMSGSQLIFCVNFITAFGIFFEGWNQGNMGFVNASPDYQVGSLSMFKPRRDLADSLGKRLMGLGENGVVNNALREGGIVAIYYLGAAMGGLWGGHVADKYGRVRGVLFGCLWVVLGASLMVSYVRLPSLKL
jgi:MFS family permease